MLKPLVDTGLEREQILLEKLILHFFERRKSQQTNHETCNSAVYDKGNERIGRDMDHDEVTGNLSELFAFEELHGQGDANGSLEAGNCQQNDFFPIESLAQFSEVSDEDKDRHEASEDRKQVNVY